MEYIYFDNGQLAGHTPYLNGLWHGIIKDYNESGELVLHTIYVYGKNRPELLKEENRLERVVLIGE